MYKIGINQNEKSNYKQKPNVKQEKKHWFKIFSLLFVVVVLIITTMILIIANNQWNSAINTNNSNNWNPNQDKTWEDYYKNNCPTNKKYNLIDYKDKLNNISLISTDKKLKNFYLSDLLKKIDNLLQINKIDIPNNFFVHLPVNPAINIKINDENALKNNFSIKIPSYKEKIKQFKIEMSVNQFGSNYGLFPCDLNFNFSVENDVIPEKFNIFDLDNRITIPSQTVVMSDATKGTKNEIESQVNKIIEEKFLEEINKEKSLSDKVTKSDFVINYDSIKNFDNYMIKKKITVVICAKNSSEIIKGQLNINFNVQGSWTKKSLSVIKTVLENDESVINQLITIEDNTNVSKVDIDNHIAFLVSKKINEFGKQKWHQDFNDQDYIITSNAITGNYQKPKSIIVTIVGKNQLQDTIQLIINLTANNTVKSLFAIKSSLENDESINTEQIDVIDDTNVSKVDIDNYIAFLVSKKINEFGKQKWHQDFNDQDYIITSNAITGNYQKPKSIIVTIVGKNQLQDTIEFSINIQCQNKEPNEKIFKNNNFNVKDLNSIELYPNVLPSGVIYPITFKDNSISLISLLFQEDINDMNNFSPTNDINLEMNIGINIDGDNYQIHFQKTINFDIIKKINNIELVSVSEQNDKYQHLKNIGIIIKYDDDKEYKMLQSLDVNIKNNNLTFINFSSIVKITSRR
ncbi:hypothetical protein [Spiroplasma endosymbiont of Monopis laevigella]|uniref:hypothetical protein n=1 Tax=Spiroplasma endosymbiont of Monopis laevigella TaxID=3066312 RepID=UPI0030CE220F